MPSRQSRGASKAQRVRPIHTSIPETNTKMSHVQHELHDEFPEYKEKIHALKIGDRHFARLFDEYHVVNREIHRHEVNGIDIADDALETMKKNRLKLKDELFKMLAG